MAKTLIVAASETEVSGLKSSLESVKDIAFLVAGVGMVNTTYCLTNYLNHQQVLPKLILNVGICGSFNDNIEIGDVIQVSEDRFSELGVQDHLEFVTADALSLISQDKLVFERTKKLTGFKQASGITVSTVHGEQESIEKVKALFNPQVESMEGAAVSFVAQQFGCPWIQIRAVSNRVEPRNRDSWDIPLALANLNQTLVQSIDRIF